MKSSYTVSLVLAALLIPRLASAASDSDNDGLSNSMETSLGTNKNNPDTDGDGLKDGPEYYTYTTNPKVADTDADGLRDGAEVNTHTTNPKVADTDADGLSDGAEVNTHTTNPKVKDTDGDALNDGAEVNTHGTNPKLRDTDGDGLNDGVELNTTHTNPNLVDTDGDAVGDALDDFPLNPAEWSDLDGDGVGDNADPDDDGNGATDALEVHGGAALIDSPAFPLVMDAIICEWDLDGPVTLANPECYALTIDLEDDYTALSYGYPGQWQESLDTSGGWTFRLGFPEVELTSIRINGARVVADPGFTYCYEGMVEALGAVTVVGGPTSYYYFDVGMWRGCIY